MDCEGFDEVVLDLVYDDGPPWPPQLDEARRHAEGCPRCSTALSTLRQARAAAELVEPPVPAGLERRILDEIERRQRDAQLVVVERAVAGAAPGQVLHPPDEGVLHQHEGALVEALAQHAAFLVGVGVAVREVEDRRLDLAGARLGDKL